LKRWAIFDRSLRDEEPHCAGARGTMVDRTRTFASANWQDEKMASLVWNQNELHRRMGAGNFKEYVRQVTEAKTQETRERRIAKIVAELGSK
jgi:hypothetical protein